MLESANLVLSSNITVQDRDRPKDEVILSSLKADNLSPQVRAVTLLTAAVSRHLANNYPNSTHSRVGVDVVLKVYIDNVIVDKFSNVTNHLTGQALIYSEWFRSAIHLRHILTVYLFTSAK
jgi:hypothetical protein